ncbi:hypothetical protein NDU88_001140 [Pleurodeles waltl]|uniref:Uncharacterized protein n=1 Tax=Pleurodeles waltl TaxID=8319 RepID=A0AAV7MKY5_PLEWA|nr:hypothetical protein NDU88_001140 [Pleurodeles waltl]
MKADTFPITVKWHSPCFKLAGNVRCAISKRRGPALLFSTLCPSTGDWFSVPCRARLLLAQLARAGRRVSGCTEQWRSAISEPGGAAVDDVTVGRKPPGRRHLQGTAIKSTDAAAMT